MRITRNTSRRKGAVSLDSSTPAAQPAGVAASALRGLSAQAVVLSCESRPAFDALQHALVEHYQPADMAEYLCVEEMAMALWRSRRAVNMETALQNHQLAVDDPLDMSQPNPPNATLRGAFAFNTLHNFSPGFRSLAQYEATCRAAYRRARRELMTLQKMRATA